MQEDFIKSLGELGLIARFKRLSDTMLYSIRDLYKLKGLDIEPNWHLIFLFLKERQTTTMTEIADALHYSQPAIVKMVAKMDEKGYLEICTDQMDARKKQLQLSQKAMSALPEFQKIWSAGEAVIQEMLTEEKQLPAQLEHMEQCLLEKNFKNRVLNQLAI